jgi:hypothetical protein
MRDIPTIFLMAIMIFSLGTGLYGLAQHIVKAGHGPAVVARSR